MYLKNISKQLLFGSIVSMGIMFNTMAANAFTWTFGAGTTDGTDTITGSFDIDDESLGVGATVSNINITIGATNFTGGNLTTPPPANPLITAGGGGISAIDFDFNNSGDLLTLGFASPLTKSGGTVTLDFSSSFNFNAVSGSVSAPRVVPFNFKTTPGLVVLGLITGVAKGKKYLPKIKEKLKEVFTKK